ncbi:MAG: Smr/MutS family protein, partial [Candidatus Eisenbacteria bacterium]
MDRHSLGLLEFGRVCAAISERAECTRAREKLRAWQPLPDAQVLACELKRLAEALRRAREPGEWCVVGQGSLDAACEAEARFTLDGPGLLGVLGWLEAARATTAAWTPAVTRAQYPELSALTDELPIMETLRERLARSLDTDGRVRDDASPALKRARIGVAEGERRLHAQLERWAAPFGEGSYVTRHGDRYVACVPAAGFSRKRGIVHDTSNSGQSLFVEPLEACEGNNQLLELASLAFEEERRIILELIEGVHAAREPLQVLERTLSALDTLRARARWGNELGAIALTPGPGPLRLIQARHPLLAMGERRESIVPLDLMLESEGRLLLVSGPNMGGKTILLKCVGLSIAMAHAALPVLVAEGSRVPIIRHLVVDLGDEQSVDRGLSTFAAHLERLHQMADVAGPESLLLADELGAGTDPEEGAALGRALVEHFAAEGAWGVLTTHLGSLKRVATEVPGVVNGSLEFDLATLTPRFRFVPGIPGASHALSVAARLGLPEALLARARQLTSDESRALERLLSEVGEARRLASEERDSLALARAEAGREAERHRNAVEDAKRSLAELRRRLTAESESILVRARELWQTVQREAKKADKSRASAESLRSRIEELDESAAALQRASSPMALGLPDAPEVPLMPVRLEVGARVRVKDLGIEAVIAALPDREGNVQLRKGSWNIRSHVDKLLAAEAIENAPAARGPVVAFTPADETPALEVDLRGMEADEALRAVDHGLDRAVLSGILELRLIHGIGKGVLKVAVEKHLRTHPQVESQRMGEGNEGGRGVTVARLR